MSRHRWGEKRRTYGSRRATCQKCGMIADWRFAYSTHWTEVSRDGGKTWEQAKPMPPCAAVASPTTQEASNG